MSHPGGEVALDQMTEISSWYMYVFDMDNIQLCPDYLSNITALGYITQYNCFMQYFDQQGDTNTIFGRNWTTIWHQQYFLTKLNHNTTSMEYCV